MQSITSNQMNKPSQVVFLSSDGRTVLCNEIERKTIHMAVQTTVDGVYRK